MLASDKWDLIITNSKSWLQVSHSVYTYLRPKTSLERKGSAVVTNADSGASLTVLESQLHYLPSEQRLVA